MLGRIETHGHKMYFVVFNNLFSSPDLTPSTKFDLKVCSKSYLATVLPKYAY